MTRSHQRKRLAVLCDGTLQTGDKTYATQNSNIAKLSHMIARESKDPHSKEVIPQVVYYQAGVGTSSWFGRGVQAGFGIGLMENVASAYHFLCTNYNEGPGNNDHDEIFLFGFSRGAYTARALGGMVTTLGLLRPEYLLEFPNMFRIYKRLALLANKTLCPDHNFRDLLDDYAGILSIEDRQFWNGLRHKTYDVKIKAIGVWDTVGALGLPDSFLSSWLLPWVNDGQKYHYVALNEKIENAFHCLALDEHRGSFQPTLWYLTDDLYHSDNCPNLKQCWFPGFHESIGGGGTAVQQFLSQVVPDLYHRFYPDASEMHEITLAWMCDQVEGLLTFDKEAVKRFLPQDDAGRANWANCIETDTAQIMPVFDMQVMGGRHTRVPGRFYLSGGKCSFRTNETIHPSVQHRMGSSRLNYFPMAFQERLTSHLSHVPKSVQSLWNWMNSSGALLWQWTATYEEGKPSAHWIRREVPVGPGQEHESRVSLPEWVIRDDGKQRSNFEVKLLPPDLRKILLDRNAKAISESEQWPNSKDQYWIRTCWEQPGTDHKRYAREQREKEKEQREKYEEQARKWEIQHHHIEKPVPAKKNKKGGVLGDTFGLHDDIMFNGGAVQSL